MSEGNPTTVEMYDAIASLRSEMCDQFNQLGKRLDNMETRYVSHPEMEALLLATNATVDGKFTVRQADAHAWAEVWLRDNGWTRVDPTAAAIPIRVELGITAAAPATPVLPLPSSPLVLATPPAMAPM